ncbi:MAG: hypothetical protein LCH56_11150 [Proteobacteria bacterium]|nr:hypothetical protein [Pseudomonadota bacterium]
MKTVLAMIVCVATAVAAQEARAQDGQLASEVRCLAAVTLARASAKTPQESSNLTTMAIYYQGRIDARDSTFDVAAAVMKEGPALQGAGLQKAFDACAKGFLAKVNGFTAALAKVK